jgi:hypothetical protein
MEAINCSETLNVLTTRYHVTQDSDLHRHICDNLKIHTRNVVHAFIVVLNKNVYGTAQK